MTGQHAPVRCTRRPGAFWSACRCAGCRARRARLRKAQRLGAIPPAPRDEAWAVLDGMLARGWTPLAIASATGLTQGSVQNILSLARRGHRQAFGRAMARRIINHGAPTAGEMLAVGTHRRLQGLAAMGWRLDDVKTLTGIPETTLSKLRRGETTLIAVQSAAAIARAYDALSMRRGPSDRSRAEARRYGWHPPLAWDDDAIDDPDVGPATGGEAASDVDPIAIVVAVEGRRVALTRAERVEVVRRMAAAGYSDAVIARRVRVTVRTVVRDREDHGIPSQWKAAS